MITNSQKYLICKNFCLSLQFNFSLCVLRVLNYCNKFKYFQVTITELFMTPNRRIRWFFCEQRELRNQKQHRKLESHSLYFVHQERQSKTAEEKMFWNGKLKSRKVNNDNDDIKKMKFLCLSDNVPCIYCECTKVYWVSRSTSVISWVA